MINSSRTRVLASCLACLTFAIASIALAKDEPTPSAPQNQDQPEAQSNQTSGPQLEAASNDQKKPSDQQNQQNAQPDQQQAGDPGSRYTGTAERGLRSASDELPPQDQPARIENQTQRGWRSNASSRNVQSRGQQGASLGVNITSSGIGQGLVITRVSPNTPAQQMGLRPSDRITSLNGNPVGSTDEFISNIRGMKPGDQVELGIVRNDNEQIISGNLEPFGQALARNEQPGGNDEFRSYQTIIQRNRWDNNQFNSTNVSRDAQRSANRFNDADRSANIQTSFEDRGPSSTPPSGDVDARLARIEQQIERLTQDVEEIRNAIGAPQKSSGLREAASAEFRANNSQQSQQTQQTQQRNAPTLPNSEAIKKSDRWNPENRFEQGDLPGSRERAALEAARRRANQTGAELQQQERERAANTKQTEPTNPTTEQPPQPTATDQPQNK